MGIFERICVGASPLKCCCRAAM